jgi:hypothetical protein
MLRREQIQGALMCRLFALLCIAGLTLAGCSDDSATGATTPENNAEEDAGNNGNDAGDEQDGGACPDEQAACLDDFGQPDQSICGATARCIDGCCVEKFKCTEDADCGARAGEDRNCPSTELDCL